jgi:MtN3 and saliva related transmembrane protein
MSFFSLIGGLAAFLTTAAYVPQAYKTIKTRTTAALSLPTYVMLFVGACLWATYGLHIGDLPVIVSNIVTAALAGIILVLKLTTKPTVENHAENSAP